jgi:hypothetical protein
MSVNRHRPHIIVIPEDDADRDLVTGFAQAIDNFRQLYATEVAGGWRNVLAVFEKDHIGEMIRCPDRLVVLLFDFDGEGDRRDEATRIIPEHLSDRVFVLGPWTNPEAVKRAHPGSTLETVGKALAQDCREGTDTAWRHELLRHNSAELVRLRERARAILFN